MDTPNHELLTCIRQRLACLNPLSLQIEDESHLHVGHAGARESGGGHFNILIVSQAFDGKSLLERHRMIYAALGEAIGTTIHALSITAVTQSENTMADHISPLE